MGTGERPAESTATQGRQVPTREGYDQWSDIYDSDGNPLVLLEEPEVERSVGSVAGLKVLDLGCGTGRHSLRLAARGAKVTACDFSEGMLAKAKGKPGAEEVEWVVHDLSTGLPFEDGAFDVVLSALVLDHVRDVDRFFAEATRVCRRGGRMVFSVMHPAMMLKGVQARFTDPGTGERVHPQSEPNQISDYVMGAARAGLRFTHMSEHAATEALAAKAERARKHLGWPLLLMMVLEHG
ncbi:MAG TPA: class I SAM-dependent methyltransferase [Phycisphaerales bacterium]|nr:class I SAM-dependent methyltransferase [Phycisphaerales bacterium]